jgi:uncharacterized membrane protein (UPF0136 family)
MSTVSLVIASVSTIGGIIGYFKSGSFASLVAGSIFGLLYISSAYLINQKNPLGVKIATIVSFILAFSMAKKALNMKPVPVIMFSLGLFGLYYYGKKV